MLFRSVVVDNQSVTWEYGSNLNPYFASSKRVEFYLLGTWLETNQDYRYQIAVIENSLEARNYKLNISMELSNENSSIFDVMVDQTIEQISISETIPPTWLPKAKISTNGFDANNYLEYPETGSIENKYFSFSSLSDIQDFKITLNLLDPNLNIYNKTYQFSELTEEDKHLLIQYGLDVNLTDSNKQGTLYLDKMINNFMLKIGRAHV